MATRATESTIARYRYWRLLSRFAAASVVATGISQLVFLLSYSLGATPVLATVLAWLAGAIPNFVLNRRTWGGGGRAALRGEILRYGAISVGTALLAALATHNAEALAHALFPAARAAQVVVVWGAFLGTYAVMFVVKFFLVDRLVFTARRSRHHVSSTTRA
ncbi:GtrA family protein [Saccharopolyspora spinosa]|uniref:GtrA-like protein n=1 Tax=Saccharopolyspora spinosa TaxID=60894 RepID=A0A2N3Y8U6_SACSN|nr:GtrA family protein [Saccharopolyspora spinosa]PKW19305.1 GtrA-like protein [Saccharopolyspora spinosa]